MTVWQSLLEDDSGFSHCLQSYDKGSSGCVRAEAPGYRFRSQTVHQHRPLARGLHVSMYLLYVYHQGVYCVTHIWATIGSSAVCETRSDCMMVLPMNSPWTNCTTIPYALFWASICTAVFSENCSHHNDPLHAHQSLHVLRYLAQQSILYQYHSIGIPIPRLILLYLSI